MDKKGLLNDDIDEIKIDNNPKNQDKNHPSNQIDDNSLDKTNEKNDQINKTSLNNSPDNNSKENKNLFSGKTLRSDSLYNKKESYDPLNKSNLNSAEGKLSQNTVRLMQLEERILGIDVILIFIIEFI